MKKVLLSSIAALSLLLISAQAVEMKCAAGKCGAAMKQGMTPKAKKMKRKGMQSPFLIKHGLPHYTKMVMKSWDDPKLGLTEEQKSKLLEVRKETMGSVTKIKPEVMKLKKKIIEASKTGAKSDTLKEKVQKLASLEAEATMTHLKCIENTKTILKPEQLQYLQEKKRARKMRHKAMMMKCKAGK